MKPREAADLERKLPYIKIITTIYSDIFIFIYTIVFLFVLLALAFLSFFFFFQCFFFQSKYRDLNWVVVEMNRTVVME